MRPDRPSGRYARAAAGNGRPDTPAIAEGNSEMAPGKRRTMLARELARTRAHILSAEWLGWTAKQPVELRSRAAILLMSLELSGLALLDAELDSLRHKLAANEAALAAAVEALARAR